MKFWREPVLWFVLLCCGGIAVWAYTQPAPGSVMSGDVMRGKQLLSIYGCEGCHTIPGMDRAHGTVGPVLSGIGSRTYLAGRILNTPENMVLWISNPKSVDPQTAMPQLGIEQRDARDIASYLFTLR